MSTVAWILGLLIFVALVMRLDTLWNERRRGGRS